MQDVSFHRWIMWAMVCWCNVGDDWLSLLRDSSVLQLIGASRATATIPFQVFHLPDGFLPPYLTWIKWTLSFNPVDAIYGIYKIVHWCPDDVLNYWWTMWISKHLSGYAGFGQWQAYLMTNHHALDELENSQLFSFNSDLADLVMNIIVCVPPADECQDGRSLC